MNAHNGPCVCHMTVDCYVKWDFSCNLGGSAVIWIGTMKKEESGYAYYNRPYKMPGD